MSGQAIEVGLETGGNITEYECDVCGNRANGESGHLAFTVPGKKFDWQLAMCGDCAAAGTDALRDRLMHRIAMQSDYLSILEGLKTCEWKFNEMVM